MVRVSHIASMVHRSTYLSRRLLIVSQASLSALFIMALLAAGTWVEGPEFGVWTFINNNYVALLTTNILISYGLATYCYLESFSVKPKNKENREIAQGGASGNIIYDWYIGRELNPQVNIPWIGLIDIKTFCELRPGMLAWIILDLAFIMRQWSVYGYVTDSISKVATAEP